ncbi:hypothetical protein Psal006b_03542 (plasmid) [Piscirickettsia salmonis]|nr:hypothetical protein Psal006b_03542 [Piscirickettsia salmonis]QGO14684.1 hypothetical protein Psal010b_03438 [Piscirickettsia salmonis]QGO25126.1 hypothetical protein Psal025_03328 [Piscirickettsia salmonis]QGO75398.1 hypothetical protein Psal098_03433 [Piscirickettsia salmonis]QGO78889.1 hypothetical protein Psal099_03438 [Piscirickettsia salmonis]
MTYNKWRLCIGQKDTSEIRIQVPKKIKDEIAKRGVLENRKIGSEALIRLAESLDFEDQELELKRLVEE